ncbi:MAG: hypothetical protein K2M19_08810 [Muribaculaceae bacterium]|nr:hypothetical protein [Muribaculaceae bacterium]
MKHLLVAIAATLAVCLMMTARKPSQADDRAAEALSAWLAIGSENAIGQEDGSTALGLLDVASAIYPADPDIAGSRARLRILMNHIEPLEVPALLDILMKNYNAHPEDILLGKMNFKYINYLGSDSVIAGMARALYLNHPTDPELAISYAQALASRNLDGDIDSALAIVNPILEAGIDPALSYYKAQLLAMRGDTAAVSLTLRELLGDAPDDPERLNGIASFYNYIQMPDSGYYYNVKACESDSTYGPALLGVAQYRLEQGDTTAFEQTLERALLTSSMDWEVKQRVLSTFTSVVSRHDEDHSQMLEFFERLRRVHSSEPAVHMMRGVLYTLMDSFPQAADDLGRVIDLDPENPEAYQLLARLYTDHNDTVRGVDVLMQGLENTGDPTMALNAAVWELLAGRPARGISHLRAIKDMDDLNKKGQAQYYNIMGDLYHALDRDSDAIAALDSSIMLDPTGYTAYNNAAYYRAVLGRELDRAESYARIAVSGDLGNPTFLDTYAWVLFKRKDFQGARVQIDLALDAYADTAEIIAVDTVPSESGFGVDTVYTLGPETTDYTPSAEVYDHAGDIYFMVGEPAQALIFWQKALMLEPENKKIKKKVDNKTYFPDESL